jgi:DNA-binding NarL/FixJ family response regulator
MEDLDSFEIQILEMLAKGYLEKHIQYRLQISEDVLQKQIASAVNKLSARTLMHLSLE